VGVKSQEEMAFLVIIKGGKGVMGLSICKYGHIPGIGFQVSSPGLPQSLLFPIVSVVVANLIFAVKVEPSGFGLSGVSCATFWAFLACVTVANFFLVFTMQNRKIRGGP
jgi:hypothetical protein